MACIGRLNRLKVIRKLENGFLLDGEELGEVLMPRAFAAPEIRVGDTAEVFVYRDAEARLVATPQKPLGVVGECAFLKVTAVTPVGAFLDWGLPKDLLVPFSEQKQKMETGKSYTVFITLDEKTGRIVGSSKLSRFLDKTPAAYQENQEVDLLIFGQTASGYRAIINNAHWGVLYKNEVFQPLQRGERVRGFIKKIREDGRIDLWLHKPGPEKVDELAEKILGKLRDQGGFLAVTDRTPAETISGMFGVSKKTYKKAVGALYRKRLLVIEETGIRLVRSAESD
ncbi:MAG: S1-like domain-containing RNA-binding protein [Thermodesulfovibrionales bacterium]